MASLPKGWEAFFMSENPLHPVPAHWELRGERIIARTRVFDLCGLTYRHPKRGTEREFISLKAPDWVNVVALTESRELILVRQFRYGINALSLEVPGGVMEPGEDPVAAGLRELAEETGYEGGSARLLGSLHPNPAIMGNRCHVVLAEGVARTRAHDWDADEELELSLAPLERALAWVADGTITHSLSVCALMLHLGHRGV